MSSLNWSDLIKDAGETTSYEPLPDGDYELKVIESKAKSTQSGKTMFSITTEVQGGPHAKRRVWDNLTVSPENPKALAIFFSKMSALGLNRDYFDTNPSNAQIEQALVGRGFRGTIGKRTYNGNVSNEVTKYFRLTADASAPAAPAAPAAAPAPAPVAAAAPAPAPAPAPAAAPAAPVTSEEPF
jgi:pyruvate/2-oxoglutarate dehydrogenase complex dihydrolipoamide acyltransferase (E2) component